MHNAARRKFVFRRAIFPSERRCSIANNHFRASQRSSNRTATSCDHLNSSLFDLDIGYPTLSFSRSSNLTELFPLLTP
jgi:hypothetical protein